MLKNALIFLCKSIAFSVVLIVVFSFSSSLQLFGNDQASQTGQQNEYDRQLKKSQKMQEENEALLEHSKALNHLAEENLKREAAILSTQEKNLGLKK